MYTKTYSKEINALFSVALEKGIERVSLISKVRDKQLVKYRRIIMVILNDYIQKQIKERPDPKWIAEIVSRDRTTFLYHEKVHVNEYQYDDYKEEFDNFLQKFEEKIFNRI